MTIITQNGAFVNYNNVTTVSINPNVTETETTTINLDDGTENNDVVDKEEKIESYLILANQDVILGEYYTQDDALKILNIVIGNAIYGHFDVVIMPPANLVNETINKIVNKKEEDTE